MPQVYIPDESEERLREHHRRRLRRQLAIAIVVLGIAASVWFVLASQRARRVNGAEGFRSEVVPPVPRVGPADSNWAARRAPFRVQVAAVETRDRASTLATQLRVDGWSVELVDDPASHRYLVQVGPYVSREEAEQVARKLRGAWGAEVRLVERE